MQNVRCQVEFTIKHDGFSAIKQHLTSLKHKNMDSQQKQNQLLHNFFESKNTSESESQFMRTFLHISFNQTSP